VKRRGKPVLWFAALLLLSAWLAPVRAEAQQLDTIRDVLVRLLGCWKPPSLSRTRRTASSPNTLGITDTRKSISRPPLRALKRPSCGTRRSAMSSSDMTLMREITCWANSTPRIVSARVRTPSIRYLIARPAPVASRWMSLAPVFSAS